MWANASSTSDTTRTARSMDRYSVAQSSSSASTTVAPVECAPAISMTRRSPWTVTSASASAASTFGRKASAIASCTKSVSAELHTEQRCALALTAMATALSRSASTSTYTWHNPSPVSMTGTVELRTTAWMRERPPRGMRTSTSPLARISAVEDSRVRPGTIWIASTGTPVPSSASRSTPTMAVLEA